MSTERCRHCGYGIPTDATSCPGCARAHAHPVPSAVARLHRPLLRLARWSRRVFVLTGCLALAAGVTGLARFVAGRDRLAEEVSATTLERLGEAAHGLALASVVAAVLALAALAAWAARARRDLGPLRVDRQVGTPWALSGWLMPGAGARAGRASVDGLWRDRSPILASLPGTGWTRRPVSRVVLHWWAPWTGVAALGGLLAVVVGGPRDLGGTLALVGVVGAALAVASLRALYDVVGIVSFAHAQRAEQLVRTAAALRAPARAATETEAEVPEPKPARPWPAALRSEPLRG